MQIILSQQCISLTGMLNHSLGYHIEHRKNGFFSKRNQRGSVPPNGHLCFIFLCAELAQNGLHITDIRVKREELGQALNEARIGYLTLLCMPLKGYYNADDVLKLKSRLGL